MVGSRVDSGFREETRAFRRAFINPSPLAVQTWRIYNRRSQPFTAVPRTGIHGRVSPWRGRARAVAPDLVIGRVHLRTQHTSFVDAPADVLHDGRGAHGTENNRMHGLSLDAWAETLGRPRLSVTAATRQRHWNDTGPTAVVLGNALGYKRVHNVAQRPQSPQLLSDLPQLNISMVFTTLLSAFSLAAALQGANAALTRRVACPDGKNTATNAACCQLFAVRDDLQENLFHGGLCTAEAHESLRLTFHDAIAISPALEAQGIFGGGGADGSIAIFSDIETAFHPNIGLDEIVELQRPFVQRHNLSVADFPFRIQFAGAIAASNCEGAPQLAAFVGRKDATQPAPDGLVPEPFHTPDQIFARLADASQGEFDPILTVWLLVAHTVAAANDVDPTVPGSPFDSTPAVWDTQLFVETLLNGTLTPGVGPDQGEVPAAVAGTLRLQSDFAISRDSRSACEWQSFVDNQPKAQAMFQFVFHDMSVFGQNITELVDCTEVVPVPAPLQGVTHFPAGKTVNDIDHVCAETPFPTLPTDPGPATTVAPVVPPPPAGSAAA